jgi:diaminopimelate epimerase
MKTIPFTKMAGAGNDFIIVDSPKGVDLKKLTVKACNRTDGIGADGVLIFDKSKKADYKMRIINADGSEAEMCGNGARCMAVYIAENKKPKKKNFSMETLAGTVLGEVKGNIANVCLSAPKDYAPDQTIDVLGRPMTVHYIDTGVPHSIVFVDQIQNIDVAKIGEAIRYHDHFKPRGTNANFVEQAGEDLIYVRTYERGVEDETKACGTGSVASAIITFLKANPTVKNIKKAKMKVITTGKEMLEVTFDIVEGEVLNVWLKGGVHLIAKGEYYV